MVHDILKNIYKKGDIFKTCKKIKTFKIIQYMIL